MSSGQEPGYDQSSWEDLDGAYQESIDELAAGHRHLIEQLRRTADQVRSLHAQLTPWYGSASPRPRDWQWIVDAFVHEASDVTKADLESLILQTTTLHHRGVDVLNPDRTPNPIPSPFVRRMPPTQEEIESKRLQRQRRHLTAYQEHVRSSIEHFSFALIALIDGCSICDWEMIDDEFPKLAYLKDEVQRAFAIWESIDGPA